MIVSSTNLELEVSSQHFPHVRGHKDLNDFFLQYFFLISRDLLAILQFLSILLTKVVPV